MSTKTEIVDCRASYCEVFSTSSRSGSFSTATADYAQNPRLKSEIGLTLQSSPANAPIWNCPASTEGIPAERVN